MKTKGLLHRAAGALLALTLALSPLPVPARAEGSDTLYIRTAEDFLAFAERCAYDGWSEGLSVVLERDVSLSGVDYLPAASFGGSFDGRGHTVSGLSVTAAVSPAGLFGEVRDGGVVRNLRVSGAVSPAGSGERVGGVAGVNRGLISGCVFSGTVNGTYMTGGLCGENAASGEVRGGRTSGGVYGKRMTGGVAGKNSGLLSGDSSDAYVNTNTLDPTVSLSELNLDLEEGLRRLASPDTYNVATDSGGVVGFNDGTVSACRGNGAVGYQHIGYNVGGVAGRSSGRMTGCVNTGTVYGRKDVGGVVGLAEPYVTLDLSSGSVEAVQAELDRLSRLVDRAADDASGLSDTLYARLRDVGAGVSAAERSAQDLSGSLGQAVDAGESTAAALRGGLPLLSRTLDALTDASGDINASLDALERALRAQESADASGRVAAGLADLRCASEIYDAGAEELRLAQARLTELAGSAGEMDRDVLTAEILAALETAQEGLDVIGAGREEDEGGAAFYLDRGAAELAEGVEALGGAAPELAAAARDAVSGARALGGALEDAGGLVSYYERRESASLPDLGEDTDALYASLREVSDRLSLLNDDVKGASDLLIGDVKKINNQFSAVLYALLGAVEDAESVELGDRVEDVSDGDVDAAEDGKVYGCSNAGPVSGDIDVGGVAGSMSVYNALNPEGDDAVTLASVVHRTYQLKCILQDCVNRGAVEGKRNNIGAICGDAQLGVISGCLACGSAESEGGDYVGGVAGRGDNILRGCWARCSLAGRNYVGGVVGAAGDGNSLRVEDCRSLVEIARAQQYAGAIAGTEDGGFTGNVFVSDALAGLDRVSLRGRAEPVDYEALLSLEDVPRELRSFTLSFAAGDRTVKTLSFRYGDSFGADVFPEIPPEEGQYGRWDRTELEDLRFDTTVSAVYAPFVTALPSAVTRSAARPVFFAQGTFTDADALTARPALVEFDRETRTVAERLRSYRRTRLEQWQLELPSDGAEEHLLRYLPPKTAPGAVELYLSDGEGWIRAETEERGSYLSFPVRGESVYLTVLSTVTPWWVYAILGVFLLNAAAVVVVLLLRKSPKTGTGEEQKRIAAFVRRRRRALAILAAAAAALGAAAGTVLLLAPEEAGAELETLLRGYAERSALDMDLSLALTRDGEAYETSAALFAAEDGGEHVSCVTWEGVSFYRRGGAVLLSDGTVLPESAALPDYTLLPGAAAELYGALEVTVDEGNGERTYTAETSDPQAAAVLSGFLPSFAGGDLAPDTLRVELKVTDGTPAVFRAVWSGEAYRAEAEAVFVDAPREHAIPAAVSAGGSAESAADAPETAGAWLELLSRAALEADVTRQADCGPLQVDESMKWQHAAVDGTPVSRLTRRGASLLFTDGAAATESGRAIDRSDPSLIDVKALLRLICAETLGRPAGDETRAGWTLETALSPENAARLAALIAPETRSEAAELAFTEGRVLLRLADGTLTGVRAELSGTTRVVRTERDASVTMELRFTPGARFPDPGNAAAVLDIGAGS